ncbi:hypothetical protein ALO44_200004 [Pseudomonas syringae pv. tagetis]|uniref:Uncharacterized protein n=1 Tax=Pseudomonas syringae pv. tagetis TaxID=129140 RepID=A0A0Q0CCI4_9PSED|nr:hypothetical protein ALO44_200004 [Pseudomonas syringae pv. tagetis]
MHLIKFVRQSNQDFASHIGVLANLCCLCLIPQHSTCDRNDAFRSKRLDIINAFTTAIIVYFTCAFVNNPLRVSIRSSGSGRASTATAYGLNGNGIQGHFFLDAPFLRF